MPISRTGENWTLGVRGLFVGHDKGSPAYLVYYPGKGKVQKHRLVFIAQTTCEIETQTDELGLNSEINCGESRNPTAQCTEQK